MAYILSIDQGTSSSRALLFDENCEIVAFEQIEFSSYYPQSGWVEQDANEIWESQLKAIQNLIQKHTIQVSDIRSIGITNQRETIVVWNKITGEPIHNAIVWQDRRTARKCETLKNMGVSGIIQDKTGLIIDAYFSASKIQWLLDHVQDAQAQAKAGELLCGTIDTWLLWKLSGGKSHKTDLTNASRTMLLNIESAQWDEGLMNLFNIPQSMLPRLCDSFSNFGFTKSTLFGIEIPIQAMIGDQQAALFGQNCFNKGDAKNTYGTGCFLLMNTGTEIIKSQKGLLTTIAWSKAGQIKYALEGSVFNAGTALQWLRDELNLLTDVSLSNEIAQSVANAGGVMFVPAFTGLGTPYWDMHARGTILGISRGTKKAHIIRAALESLAQRSNDVLESMVDDSGIQLKSLKVDGGASQNDFLMQFQADLLDVEIIRPISVESTARGAAMIAGIQAGFYDLEIIDVHETSFRFYPKMKVSDRQKHRLAWKKAISKSMNWADA